MLLGEDLGGGHHGGLVAGLHGRQHRQRGHDRLARAHVALQQAMHRVRCGHVAPDLVPHALLGAGERPRQARAQALHERARRIERDALRARGARAQDGEPELQQQEVLEGQPPMRRRQLRLALGEVHAHERLGDGRQPATLARGLGQRLADIGRIALHELVHQRAQRALVQALGGRVDGHQRAGVDRLVVVGFHELPVLHLQGDLVPEARALAVQHQLLAALEHAREPAAAE